MPYAAESRPLYCTQCKMMSNQVEVSDGKTIVAVPATLLRIVKEHQKQVVRVASIAGNFKTILSAPRKPAKGEKQSRQSS